MLTKYIQAAMKKAQYVNKKNMRALLVVLFWSTTILAGDSFDDWEVASGDWQSTKDGFSCTSDRGTLAWKGALKDTFAIGFLATVRSPSPGGLFGFAWGGGGDSITTGKVVFIYPDRAWCSFFPQGHGSAGRVNLPIDVLVGKPLRIEAIVTKQKAQIKIGTNKSVQPAKVDDLGKLQFMVFKTDVLISGMRIVAK